MALNKIPSSTEGEKRPSSIIFVPSSVVLCMKPALTSSSDVCTRVGLTFSSENCKFTYFDKRIAGGHKNSPEDDPGCTERYKYLKLPVSSSLKGISIQW